MHYVFTGRLHLCLRFGVMGTSAVGGEEGTWLACHTICKIDYFCWFLDANNVFLMRFMVFVAVCARAAIPLFGTLTTHLYALQHGFAWVASAQMHNYPPDGACSHFSACKPRLAGIFRAGI